MRSKYLALSLLALSVLLLACDHPSPSKEHNDLSEQNLLGKVKTLVEEYYYYRSDTDQEGKVIDSTSVLMQVDSTRFDKAGFIEEIYATSSSSEECFYDEEEDSVDSIKYHRKTEYKRSPASKILVKTLSFNGKVYQEKRYRYNEAGLMSEEAFYFEGNLSQTLRYTYDAQGHVLTERTYSETDSLMAEATYTYNAEGLCTQMKRGVNTIWGYTERYAYDKQGNKTEEYAFDEETGKFYLSQGMTYDNKGRILSIKTLNESGDIVQQTSYRYDQYGNSIEERDEGGKGEEAYSEHQTHEYLYDKQGNWTACVTYTYLGGVKVKIALSKRRITYY